MVRSDHVGRCETGYHVLKFIIEIMSDNLCGNFQAPGMVIGTVT
jgi:hypothetical protein